MKKHSRNWTNAITDNGSYKLVALFVTLILWATILGRRDFVTSKEISIEFLMPRHLILKDRNEQKVKVEVSGPRTAIKKFSSDTPPITVDLGRGQLGSNRVILKPRNVEVPFGVKVLSITPEILNVDLIQGE